MNYRYEDGQAIFPGDFAAWYHAVEKRYYVGKIVFRRPARYELTTRNFEGLLMQMEKVINRPGDKTNRIEGELEFPMILSITERDSILLRRKVDEAYYLSGEKVEDGDIVVDEPGNGVRFARVKLLRGKSNDEPWDPGNKIFIELNYFIESETPTYFSYIDRDGEFISECMQEIHLVGRRQ